MALMALTACAVQRHPVAYSYGSPIADGRGCASLLGTYTLTLRPDSHEAQNQRAVIRELFRASGQSLEKWEAHLAKMKMRAASSVDVAVSGELGGDLAIVLHSEDDRVIDTIRLSRKTGQYTCGGGRLSLPDIRSKGTQHEVGSYSSFSEFSLCNAVDGALVGHFRSSSRGWTWFIPYFESHEDWAVIPRSRG